MKKLRAFCPPCPEGFFINQVGREFIRNKKIELLDTSGVFVSSHTRALQTAIYMMEVLEKDSCRITTLQALNYTEIEEMLEGNKKFLSLREKKNNSNIYSLIKESFSEENLLKMEEICADSINKCFDNMKQGDEFMLVSDNPFISMAANHFEGNFHGRRKFDDLEKMDFIDFFMDDDGEIFVSDNFFTL